MGPARRELDLKAEGISGVVWATGYRTDWLDWIQADVFDIHGYPQAQRGVTCLPGLYFVGLTWMSSWGSGLLFGVAQDAAHVVEHLTGAPRL